MYNKEQDYYIEIETREVLEYKGNINRDGYKTYTNEQKDKKILRHIHEEWNEKFNLTAIKDLDEKIKLADNYGTQNESLGLKAKKQRMLEELNNLQKQKMYGGRVLGQIPTFTEQFKEKMPVLYKVQNFISRNLLAKISKKVNSVVALSDSLEQLSNISKSVDELIDMNIPYGERVQNYEKLTQYLSKANSIHSKISQSLRK